MLIAIITLGTVGYTTIEKMTVFDSFYMTLITISTRAAGERRPGWVGLPLTGVRTRLVDEDGVPSPHDGETIGALQVQTPTMFDGYLNLPEATANAFDVDGWYRSGDAAVVARRRVR